MIAQEVYLLGLNHRTAGVDIREKFALQLCDPGESAPGVMDFVIPLSEALREILIVSTCNRVEILAVGSGDEAVEQILRHWAGSRGAGVEELRPYVYIHKGYDAAVHLFSVASSLDSMVVGEPQILGQLKDAYRLALKRKTTGVILNRMLHKAFSVAKRVRTETAVASSAVSISYAAVQLAKRIFGDMGSYQAMLIGAGEMAELAAANLLRAGIHKVFVANRTHERAVELAAQFQGEAIVFEELFNQLTEVDIVISSTGAPSSIIHARDVKRVLKKRKNRPMFFIDIAVPRDVDPDVNNLDNVYLYDIDDLKEVVEENLAHRRDEAAKARSIVRDEAVWFGKWMQSLDLQPTIVELLARGDELADKELAKTLKRLGGEVSEEAREALETLTSSIVRKLYHDPIMFLKRRSEEEESRRRFVDVTRRMFNLDNESPPPKSHMHRRRHGGDSTISDGDFTDEDMTSENAAGNENNAANIDNANGATHGSEASNETPGPGRSE